MVAESSDNLEWDNYRENPSFALDPEEDTSQEQVEEVTVHQAGRVSSTDEQFLDREVPPVIKPFIFDYNQDNQYSVWPPRNPSSEPNLFFEESLLPRELLASIEEEAIYDNVFLKEDSSTIEETMSPNAAPTPAQIYATFKEKVEEFGVSWMNLGEYLLKTHYRNLVIQTRPFGNLLQSLRKAIPISKAAGNERNCKKCSCYRLKTRSSGRSSQFNRVCSVHGIFDMGGGAFLH